MKSLAASSIGEYERAVVALNQYYRTLELGIAACLRHSPPAASPFATPRTSPRLSTIGAVIFGSDQGLVGRFNEELVEFAFRSVAALPATSLDETPGTASRIWAVGERLHALLADAPATQVISLPVPASVHAITLLVGQLLLELEAASERGIAEVYLFHNQPQIAAAYTPVGKRLLPLDQLWQSAFARLSWPTRNLPEVLGEPNQALQALIREYLFVLLFQACAESLASENASRLSAMQRAEKNVDAIVDELEARFHRLRQEAIDEELFDVISGYSARSETTGPRAQPPGERAKPT
jgi:F-type H+-transporting ATPase subunit gamma